MNENKNVVKQGTKEAAYLQRELDRVERVRSILSLPFGPQIGYQLASIYFTLLGWYRRTLNYWRAPETFNWRCHYCGKPTRQSPYIDEDDCFWPACCSRRRCLDRWESQEPRCLDRWESQEPR